MVKLLAPAASAEGMRAVLNSGADAVYVGVNGWGLRPTVFEPSESELQEGIHFAHAKGKEVYVCANILPKPRELPRLLADLHRFHAYRVDAAIMSDWGLIDLVHQHLPDLPIHASVQCNVMNAEAARFYQELGASTVILSRSLVDLDEIRAIRQSVDVGLEVFIHGDICQYLDARCYLSAYLRQEQPAKPSRGDSEVYGSSNRGECYLVCKHPCSLAIDGTEVTRGTLLRRQDLCTLTFLPQLLEMRIDILKIEGRQFPLEYGTTTTAIYRQAIDLYQLDPQAYRVKEDWLRQLQEVWRDRHRMYELQERRLFAPRGANSAPQR